MIRIIDTYEDINCLFDDGNFNIDKWKTYINNIYNDSADIFQSEMNDYIATGMYTYEKDFLPIINDVYKNPKLDILHASFEKVVNNLNQKVLDEVGKELDVEVVLYIGLCNGAGWVTNINGRDTVLLGIEKIMELNWCDVNSVYGLIYHELGHVYQKQYGILKREFADSKNVFLWQLFVEGIAMYFEQVLVGNPHYYQQDANGWKTWCDEHFLQIKEDFQKDLDTMTRQNQRYFGDWCNYHGKGDVGYYLGARFIQYVVKTHSLKQMINYELDEVYELYCEFMEKCE